jgi:polyribonucleotide nucleotidyltransferase
VQKKLVRERILRDKVRIDGRGLRDIRALGAEVEVLPRVHGSAIFERGETQIMGVTTLNMLKHGAAARHPLAGDAQALHAQLQLPAVLHR